jgi:hypothetical protein
MSDFTQNESVDDTPVESGQVESVDIEASGGEDIFDISEYADRKVGIKVDGKDEYVPLSEAVAGYQRQADYTRKTQELATQREQMQFATAIQEALQQDPNGTIQLLQQHYGLGADAQSEPEVPEFSDPLEKQIWEVSQKVEQIEAFRAEQQLQAEIGRLQSQYEDFDPQMVILSALKTGSNDLEATYKQMSFDKLYSQMKAQSGAQQVIAEQENNVLQAKRDAGIVSGGASAASSGNAEPSINSISDAWAAAKRSHGGF